MERSRRIRYRDYWARRAFGSRVIFDLSCVSIATVMDLMVYAACSPVRRRPASDLITFGNKSIPEMPVHGHDPQSIPEVWDRAGQPPVVGLRGDLHAVFGQHGADRLDPETVPVGVDIAEFYLSRRSSSAWAKNALAVFRMSFARRNSATS